MVRITIMAALQCSTETVAKDKLRPVGPISSITVLGQTMVIISDPEVAFELMRDRSAIHSSRPSQIFSGEMYA